MLQKFAAKLGFTRGLSLLIPFVIVAGLFIITPLVMILVKALIPVGGGSVADNWLSLGETAGGKIGKSFLIALIATAFCVLLGFPFAYVVGRSKSKVLYVCMVILITAPIWSSLLIKLIGLKVTIQLFFTDGDDLMSQLWTIMGVIYVYIPFLILPLITSLRELPNNLLEASRDLGRKSAYTFFAVTLPWTRTALTSGLMLVFLPALTTVAIPEFLDHSSSGQLIGNIVYGYGERGFTGEASLANAASLSIVVSAVMMGVYLLIVLTPRVYRFFAHRKVRSALKRHAPPRPDITGGEATVKAVGTVRETALRTRKGVRHG